MKLTKRELDVMKILWNAKKPLMVSEIVQLDNDSTIYSVQRLISNLLKKGMIEVDSIVFNQKALARKLNLFRICSKTLLEKIFLLLILLPLYYLTTPVRKH